ncbi:MAG: hypothetical protein WC648_00590 [Candidatus Paceibacterota bacterium]|jgi:hypothetical protein
MNKYDVGQRIPREGKTSLVVFECMDDGRYAARTLHTAVQTSCITVNSHLPHPNEVITLPNGKEVIFIGPNPDRADRWDVAYQDRIEVTDEQIDEALTDLTAREIFSSVATRCEQGGNSRNLRYLPRRTEPREED